MARRYPSATDRSPAEEAPPAPPPSRRQRRQLAHQAPCRVHRGCRCPLGDHRPLLPRGSYCYRCGDTCPPTPVPS